MYNIILICTAHSEIGKCNSGELYKIIEEYKPEIIFEELSLNAYNECYGNQNRFTLETSAIKRYLVNHKIEHIPIVGSELTKDLDCKFEILTKYSNYRSLIDTLTSLEEKNGFQFLNSEQCDELFEKITTLERQILKDNDDIILSRIYQWGNETIDKYENEILKNVYDYSTVNEYNTALMFIGSAHRKSIMQKIHEYERIDNLELKWTLYRNQDLSHI
jgi:hypothetical protein